MSRTRARLRPRSEHGHNGPCNRTKENLMAKYLLLKHYRGAPASVNDVPMDQWTPEEVSAPATARRHHSHGEAVRLVKGAPRD